MIFPDPNRQEVWMEAVNGLADWFVLTKTDTDIARCIRWREVESKFSDHADFPSGAVTAEQDSIGWLSFTEGKLSAQWKEVQEVYYISICSNGSSRQWAQGLIQQLLSMVHKMWIAWNAVVHEQDDNSCLTREKKETEEAIQDQFELEYEDLWPQDWHLMEMGQEMVLNKTVSKQQAWLHDIRIT